MNSKILLLSIAVISVGLFAMPSTLSLFAGQHTFYAGENVSCSKCHQDIYTEMTSGVSDAHTQTALKECQGCHKTTTTGNISNIPVNGTNVSGNYTQNITTNANAHAAVTLECVTCHTGVPAELTGSQEAHTVFYYGAISNKTNTSGVLGTDYNQSVIQLKGANTACVGCHTHATINVTWVRAKGYNLIANESTGSYNLTFEANQTSANINTSYSAGQ